MRSVKASGQSPEKSTGRATSREARLAEKLRENLKRRKSKERALRNLVQGDAHAGDANEARRDDDVEGI